MSDTDNTLLDTLVPTEQRHPDTVDIDLLPTEQVLTQINQLDSQVPAVVAQAIPQITQVVDWVINAFEHGGRLFYVGAGTSGRLGVLDASECVPTFGVPPEWVQGIIAGGDKALRHPIEGAEDDAKAGALVVSDYGINAHDVVIGISASGGAAFIVEAVNTARALGARTAALTCVAESRLAKASEIAMVTVVGPEAIAGSSRLKAGTAQKLVLNMITTASMIGIGKTYENWMVDVRPTNQKLRLRAQRLVSVLANVSLEQALALLEEAQWQVKSAVVMGRYGVTLAEAASMLAQHHGKLRQVFQHVSHN